jgi:hypothetical protein
MIFSKKKPETPMGLGELDSTIRKSFEVMDIPETKNIAFCVHPKRQLMELNSAKYKKYGFGSESNKIRVNSNIYFAKSLGRFAAYYGTAHSLEYRSHRFVFDEHTTTYHREPFDTDFQAMPSKRLNLVGLPEIAEVPSAVDELTWLTAQLFYTGSLHTNLTDLKVDSVHCDI